MSNTPLSPELEREVQARVAFILETFETKLKNSRNINKHVAMHACLGGDPRWHEYQDKAEADDRCLHMLREELSKPYPVDRMYEYNRRSIKDQAISKLIDGFAMRGTKDYHMKVERAVNLVEWIIGKTEDINQKLELDGDTV